MEPPITETTFFKFQLPVPQELRDFCVDEKAADIHNEFMKAIDACNVRFDAAKVVDYHGQPWSDLLMRTISG